MSKYFSVREPVVVTVGDQSHTFWVRELPYQTFRELSQKASAEGSDVSFVTSLVLACVEEEDGSKSYDEESWGMELRGPRAQLGKAALKAHGIDLDKVEEKDLTPEEVEGNA